MSSANNILKMLIGIVVLIVGILWYVPKGFYGFGFWSELRTILLGAIGIFLVFIGLIVAWMGYDDYKMDAEMAKEEKKETAQ